MAVSMTYNSLLADLRTYLERGYVADTQVYNQLPSLVNLAERAIILALKIQGFQNVVTTDLMPGVSVYAKPDRWRQTISMEFGVPRQQIFARDYEYCRTYWPDSTERAAPEFYADYGYSHWLIVPTPVLQVPWQITYYQQPPYLEASNQTNWLTDYAPNALLYRALMESSPYLKDDQRIATWKQMYDEVMGGLNVDDVKKIIDRNVTRQEA